GHSAVGRWDRGAVSQISRPVCGARRGPRRERAMSFGETDIPDLSRRVAVVTGANSGIGFETARALAAKGARVILGCRSRTSGPEAARRIRDAVPDADVHFISLDLASLRSIEMFAKEVAGDADPRAPP